MCGRYHFSAELLDEIRDVTEQKDWKLEHTYALPNAFNAYTKLIG